MTVAQKGIDTEAPWNRVWRIAWNPPLRNYVSARFLDMVAIWMLRLTNSLVVWQLTHSPTMIGVALACQLGPAIIIEPAGGVLADRYDRRRVMAVTQTISALLTILIGFLIWNDLMRIDVMLLLLLLSGSVIAVSQASSRTIVTALVNNYELPTAVSLYSVAFNLAAFTGPPLAGLLIALYGPAYAYFAAAALMLAFVTILVLRVPPIRPGGGTDQTPFIELLGNGFRHVTGDALLLALFALHISTAMLSRPFLEFVPGLVDELFSGGVTEIAIVTAAIGAGSTIGGLWLASRDPGSLVKVALVSTPIIAAAMFLFFWIPSFWMAPPVAFLIGIGMIARGAAIQSLVQLEAGRAFRGRVAALYGVSLDFGAIMGTFLIGIMAEFMGFRIAGTLAVILAFIVWLLLRQPLIDRAKDKDLFAEH
jgi:MFS family permease